MTHHDDFIAQLEGYLDEYEGSTPLPDDVRHAIRARLPSTQQRLAWWPAWRFPAMNSIAKLGLAAAAVTVAAFLGFNYLIGPNIGSPRLGDPSPSPNPTPRPFQTGPSLSPGTYAINAPFPVRVTFDVPAGWFAWISNADVAGLVVDNGVGDGGSGWGGPNFWIVDNVYTDPCDPTSALDPPLGPSVDDLVTALTSLPGYAATAPTDITVSGFPGAQIELTAPEYGEECRDHRTWSTDSEDRAMLPGETNRLQILDVDGVRLVIVIVEYAHTTEFEQLAGIPYDADAHVADQAELRQILDSIRIESQP